METLEVVKDVKENVEYLIGVDGKNVYVTVIP